MHTIRLQNSQNWPIDIRVNDLPITTIPKVGSIEGLPIGHLLADGTNTVQLSAFRRSHTERPELSVSVLKGEDQLASLRYNRTDPNFGELDYDTWFECADFFAEGTSSEGLKQESWEPLDRELLPSFQSLVSKLGDQVRAGTFNGVLELIQEADGPEHCQRLAHHLSATYDPNAIPDRIPPAEHVGPIPYGFGKCWAPCHPKVPGPVLHYTLGHRLPIWLFRRAGRWQATTLMTLPLPPAH
jgi:hypothetical protein